MGQYVTAVFEMRPARRSAAAVERVRVKNEDAFWEALDASREKVKANVMFVYRLRVAVTLAGVNLLANAQV